jgi:hypothetical protein
MCWLSFHRLEVRKAPGRNYQSARPRGGKVLEIAGHQVICTGGMRAFEKILSSESIGLSRARGAWLLPTLDSLNLLLPRVGRRCAIAMSHSARGRRAILATRIALPARCEHLHAHIVSVTHITAVQIGGLTKWRRSESVGPVKG